MTPKRVSERERTRSVIVNRAVELDGRWPGPVRDPTARLMTLG